MTFSPLAVAAGGVVVYETADRDMTAQTQSFPLVITQSWHRCSKFMQRETRQTPHQAQGLTFESICRRKTALLTIGQAALEDAWEFMDNRPCAPFILDESACISAAAAIRRPSTSWRRWDFVTAATARKALSAAARFRWPPCSGSRSKRRARSILNMRCTDGRLAPRRCLITTGVCSVPFPCAA
jgi:hypothetical protein